MLIPAELTLIEEVCTRIVEALVLIEAVCLLIPAELTLIEEVCTRIVEALVLMLLV